MKLMEWRSASQLIMAVALTCPISLGLLFLLMPRGACGDDAIAQIKAMGGRVMTTGDGTQLIYDEINVSKWSGKEKDFQTVSRLRPIYLLDVFSHVFFRSLGHII